MFYSHEILTSREGGVATVWLVATLGSKSNLKKVNRKAIQDVDVPKTCEIIITPEAPMALRLQSNLLYGVSRVYSQQCGYVLSDAQTAQSNMRALLKAVRTAELDPNAGKARLDQLVLEDDPAFLPDFFRPGLDIDLSALNISTDNSSHRSSILSPHSQRSSLSSRQDGDGSMQGLIIPTSDTGDAGEIGGFVFPGTNLASDRPSSRLRSLLEDEEGFNLDSGFKIDEDGNVVLTGDEAQQHEQAAVGTGGMTIDGDIDRFGPELEGRSDVTPYSQILSLNTVTGRPIELGGAPDIDLDLPRLGDDDIVLPDAEAFPEMVHQAPAATGLLRSSSTIPPEEDSSESAMAPHSRKRRGPKELPTDMAQELRNADLAQWNNDYVANMTDAVNNKAQHQASSLAKKNATFWIAGAGIGGVGSGVGMSKFRSPLDMFAGAQLLEALTGLTQTVAGKKRARAEEGEHDSESEERRVRMKEDEDDQLGRGEDLIPDEDNEMGKLAREGIEVGRHAQPALEDPSLQFPWNLSSSAVRSRQGSIARGPGFPSSAGGFPSSVGRPSSLPAIGGAVQGSLDHRASRITSASPLVAHGSHRFSSLELPLHEEEDEHLEGSNISSAARHDFELHGPAANVDTQTAATSQWFKAALDEQSSNFLMFIKENIATKRALLNPEEDELTGDAYPQESVLFEDLLPPAGMSKVVAAQGLLHVLALATKDLIHVHQEIDYGPIDLRLAAGV